MSAPVTAIGRWPAERARARQTRVDCFSRGRASALESPRTSAPTSEMLASTITAFSFILAAFRFCGRRVGDPYRARQEITAGVTVLRPFLLRFGALRLIQVQQGHARAATAHAGGQWGQLLPARGPDGKHQACRATMQSVFVGRRFGLKTVLTHASLLCLKAQSFEAAGQTPLSWAPVRIGGMSTQVTGHPVRQPTAWV